MTPTVCDVNSLLHGAADAMQAMANDYDISLDVNISNTPSSNTPSSNTEALKVWADPDQVMQALTNLISNAIKFSPRASKVWLKAKSQDTKVEFLVRDVGRGVPSDKLETIFERFQQVDTSDARERGGTGLGLAICREIIQQHQGRIWVKSIHGQGSSFYFTLPKPEAAANQTEDKAKTEQTTKTQAAGSETERSGNLNRKTTDTTASSSST